MDLVIPDYLPPFNALARAVLVMLVLILIWAGSFRIPAYAEGRFTTAGILSGALLGWLALASYLGAQNVYWAPNNLNIPTIQFGILIPIIAGLWLITRSESAARLIDALPLSWLAGIQVYRALGAMFLVLWSDGYLPWQFALPAGIGDVLTGILALVVAGMIHADRAGAQRAVYLWCLFGIADLVIAVTMGALTSPGRFHLLSQAAPNLLITANPLVMIPTFAVPLSIILHGLCLWKLRRLREQARPAQAMAA